jgi:hypothetical protein
MHMCVYMYMYLYTNTYSFIFISSGLSFIAGALAVEVMVALLHSPLGMSTMICTYARIWMCIE